MKSSNAAYKVFFEGSSLINKENLSLTFFRNNQEYLKHPQIQKYLTQLEKSDQKVVKSLKNIKEILPIGNYSKDNITKFVVILVKKNEKQETKPVRFGYLFGHHNKEGFKDLGFWPFREKETSIELIPFQSLVEDFSNQKEKYEEFLIIS